MSDQYTADPPAPEQKSGSRLTDTTTLVLLAVVVVFALTNSRSTKITWLVASSRAPLFIVIGICVAVGFAAGYLTAQRKGKG